MRVLVSGSSGLIGIPLVASLKEGGHEVLRLVRSRSLSEPDVGWDPDAGAIDAARLTGLDAVVHLAGETIGERWSEAKKAKIMESRAKGTRLLAGTLAGLSQRPKVLVSASAIGFYGDRGDEPLREESDGGTGFLAGVCRAWEAATEPASEKGIRVVLLRFGPVLSADGGALARMLTPFRLGLGGVLGDGRQYMSWIALDDAVGAIRHALEADALEGPANAVAPDPVTNREFTKTLGRVLGRPAFLPLPAFVLRLAFSEMADEMLLASARVEPARLLASGYEFRFPELEGALRHVLGR